MGLHREQVHPEYVEGCFGCKAMGLQMNSGDAHSEKMVSNKKWESRLARYRQAKADGIQPEGTQVHQVEAAYKASEVLGKAYNAETMTKARDINKNVAEIMKEVEKK